MPENKETTEQGVSRRDIFQILGTASIAVASAGAAVAEPAVTHPPKAPFHRQIFDDRQWKTVHVLCDLVIPADDRSGSATQAGVPEFLDDWIAFRTEQDGNDRLKAQILGGIMWLDRESNELFSKDFADASLAQQKQLLDRIAFPARHAPEDGPAVMFFSEFRDLTVAGFFSSKVGVADLPYLGNTVVVEWKGCDPKVWAVIEERMKNGYHGLLNPGDISASGSRTHRSRT
jgi:gluconate 2-dehydrogenase gamma chain